MYQQVRNFFKPKQHDIEALANDGNLDWSPDYWKLEQFKRLRVFVYGDQMTGMKNNHMVAEFSHAPEPLHPTVYTSAPFTFFKKDLGDKSYPVMLPGHYQPDGFMRWPVEPHRVKGELWAVRPQAFKKYLDEHHRNGVMFIRERIAITLPYREVGWSSKNPLVKISPYLVQTVDAWAYIGVPEYWNPQIGGLFASTQVMPRERDNPVNFIQKYYRFDNEEPPF